MFYEVQLGVFELENNAKAVVEELKEKGIVSEVMTCPTLYKVRVGEYQEKQYAEDMQNKLYEYGYDDIIIKEVE